LRSLVLGGGVFLGSHVADQLSISGHDVTLYDRQPSLWLRSDQKMIVGDILDERLLEEAISSADVVYNFAAIADLNEAIDKPIESVRINILGNLLALNFCKKYSIKRFVFASSVYVNSRHGGFYRCSKQASEQYIVEFQRKYGVDYTILRYGSLYGPRADHTNGLYRTIKNALETGRINYVGSPDTMREFIHVEDAAVASVEILNDQFRNATITLTGQQPIKMKDLLYMLAEILDYQHSVEFIEGGYEGHYVRTPYAYQPALGKTYIPSVHVDLGQGLLQLIYEVRSRIMEDNDKS